MRTIVGEVLAVAVDIRRNSSTFGRWVGVNLSAQDHLQLRVPKGFAHGVFILSGWAEVIYKTTDYSAPERERVLLWNDPALGIGWPLCDRHAPILSGRDSKGFISNEAKLFDGEAAG